MGILSFLSLGKQAGDAIASPIEAVGNAIDKIFTSDEEKIMANVMMEKIAQQPQILQSEINKLEAQHRSLFVAGWRPFIGWICGLGLLWHYLGSRILSWIFAVKYPEVIVPVFDGTGDLINLLLALLGMAGLRTIEKNMKITK